MTGKSPGSFRTAEKACLPGSKRDRILTSPIFIYGNAHANAVPYGVFETADGQMILAIANDGQWQRFCPAMSVPALGELLGLDSETLANYRRQQVI